MSTYQSIRRILKIPNGSGCSHIDQIKIEEVKPGALECADCLQLGDTWVHLRMCMICGYVGCCDDSKNKHATRHYHTSDHPIIRSLEPGEDWLWCYADGVFLA
ncbi:MAG: hypothetical protein EHM70_08765 [Chloroflexota bacterium]|nr:MAG: hypothetical protein EHM70_08765 [Chloroflexota bacterium]